MANQTLTNQRITQETNYVLQNNCVAVQRFYRELDPNFGKKGDKIGDTLYVRKPPRFVGRDGAAFQPEGLTDTQVPVTINQQSGQDFILSSIEARLSIDDLRNRYLAKMAIAIKNKLDVRAMDMARLNTGNFVGTIGTTPGLSGSDAVQIYSQAQQKLHELGANMKTERTIIFTPAMQTGWNVYTKALFNPQGMLATQMQTGRIGNPLGAEWEVDQNCPSHTVGALGGTPAVAGAGQTGTSINLSGLTASITNVFKAGDCITFANVLWVNPQSRVAFGSLFQTVIKQDASSDSGGLVTVNIFPGIVPSGQFQNTDSSPANGALVSVFGAAAAGQGAIAGLTFQNGILFDKMAYAFVAIAVDVPDGTNMAYTERESDIPLRFVQDFNTQNDQWQGRFDCYYGTAPLYPEVGLRILS